MVFPCRKYSSFILFFVIQIIIIIWICVPYNTQKRFIKSVKGKNGQDIFYLKDGSQSDTFYQFKDNLCLKEGTIPDLSSNEICSCSPEWLGKHCGMPKILKNVEWINNENLTKRLKLRKVPRRLIYVTVFTGESDIMEISFRQINELVDIFIVGDLFLSKKVGTSLLEILENGWLKEFQEKFIYIPVAQNLTIGAAIHDTFDYIVKNGFKYLSNIRPDDVIFFASGKEIVRRETLSFLSMFNNYPVPVKCSYDKYFYGFYWKNIAENKTDLCAVSFNFFSVIYDYKYSNMYYKNINTQNFVGMKFKYNPTLLEWVLTNAGWQCQFCESVKEIYLRLANLPSTNRVEWFTESLNDMIPFLQRLIKFGQDFNMKKLQVENLSVIEGFPFSKLLKEEKFEYLILNKYRNISLEKIYSSNENELTNI